MDLPQDQPDLTEPASSPAVEREPSPVSAPEPFRNEPVGADGLPRLAEQTFEPLDPAYLRVRRIASVLFAVVAVIIAIVLAIGLPIPFWIPILGAVVVLLLTALGMWLQTLEVNNLGYLVRDKDFSFRRGVIQRSVATVPFARVQHVSIQRGPLERWFGLATLEMKTAGDHIQVPGMSADTAARLKDLVVDRAGSVADEEAELR